MTNQFVWVDIPVRELDRAIGFSTAVSGAPVKKESFESSSFGIFPHADTSVAGCLYKATTTSLPKTSLVASTKPSHLQHGGKSCTQAPIGPHGFRAIVVDSEGNRIGLHSPSA